MSKELVETMLKALTEMVDSLANSTGEGDWLDGMSYMDEPVFLAEEAIKEAKTFLEGKE